MTKLKSWRTCGLVTGFLIAFFASGIPAKVSAQTVDTGTILGVSTYTSANLSSWSNGMLVPGPDGAVWGIGSVSGSANLTRISTTGAVTLYPITSGHLATALATGPDGAFWITTTAGTVERITTSGTLTNQFTIPTPAGTGVVGTSIPIGILTGPDGNLWVLDQGAYSYSGEEIYYAPSFYVVWQVSTSGAFTSYTVSSGYNGSYPLSPQAFTVGPDGNIWITVGGLVSGEVGALPTAWGSVVSVTTSGVTSSYSVPYSSSNSGCSYFGGDNATLSQGLGAIAPYSNGSAGSLFFFLGSNCVDSISTDGSQITNYQVPTVIPAQSVVSGTSLIQGPDGGMWLTNITGGYVDLTPAFLQDSSEVPVQIPANSANEPGYMTIGPDGAFWSVPCLGGVDGCTKNLQRAVLSVAAPGTVQLPSATIGTPYSPGSAGLIFEDTEGGPWVPYGPPSVIPPGLQLNETTGLLSGTPQGPAGTFTIPILEYSNTEEGTYVYGNFNITIISNVGPPANIAITAGNNQTAVVNTQYAQALAVTVTDANQNPVPNVNVTFGTPIVGPSATFGGGVTVQTNSNGVATSPLLTANLIAGALTATATLTGLTPVTFNLTNLPGPPAQITASGPETTVVNTNFPGPLSVTVKDAYGNTVPNDTVTFTVPSSGPSALFVNALTGTAITNGNGVATAPTLTANGIAGGPYNLAAVPATTVAGVSTSISLTNTPGAVASLNIYSGNPQTAQVQTAFTNPLVVIARDASGNPVSNVTISFTTNPGANGQTAFFTGGGTTAIATTIGGYATSPNLQANRTAGNYTVTATYNGNFATSFTLANTPGPATALVILSGNNQSAVISTNFALPLVTEVEDAYGNAVPNVGITYTALGTTASALFGTSATANVQSNASGYAQSPTPTANGTVGGYSVNASFGGVSVNFSLQNTVGTAAHINGTAGSGQSAKVGTAFPTLLQATVTDSGNNPVGGVTVTFTAPGAQASGTFPGNALAVNAVTSPQGVATAPTFTANGTVGTYNVHASVNGVATSATFQLTNTQGNPGSIAITSGNDQSAQVKQAFGAALVVTVRDNNNNPVSNATVTFTAPSTPASATFNGANSSSVQTDQNGVATSPIPLATGKAGNYNVSASVPGAAAPVSFALTNTPGPATTIAFQSGDNQTAGIDSQFTTALAALVTDAGGNPVSNVNVTFTAPGTGPSGTFAGNVTSVTVQTKASGVATAPAFTANATTGTYNVQAAAAGVNNPLEFALKNVTGLVITTTTLPAGTFALNYSQTLTSQNGTGPYNWTVSAGTLPTNLTLNPLTGVLSGLANQAGTFNFTVKLTDSSTPTPQTATQALVLVINQGQTTTPPKVTITLPATPTPGTAITGLTAALNQPSADALTGTLSLSLTPNAAVTNVPAGYLGDAGLQTANGSAGTTSLLVPALTSSVPLPDLDPGTVAGTITMDLVVGGQVVSTSTTTIPAEAPVIMGTPTITPTANGFEIEVIAYSTTRDLETATFTFTPASGAQITGSSIIPVQVTSTMTTWFAGQQGLNYGGSFSLTIPFTLSSGSISDIQSFTVSLTNSIGSGATSAPVTP